MELGASVLEGLDAELDTLEALDSACLGDSESQVGLARAQARVQALSARAAAAFDSRAEWAVDGARSAPAWLAKRCRLPKYEARRTVRLGRAMRNLPVAGAAFRAGEIGAAQVEALAAVRREATEEALARDEEMLVGQARALGYDDFTKVVAYWEQLNDPDGADEGEDDRHAKRGVWLDKSFEGMFLGNITLDPISGTIVSEELARLERALFEADWAEAKARLGHDPVSRDLARTPAQRRADALQEMARRSGATAPDARRPAPLFSVFVGYETMHGRICELANGTVVSPSALVPWLDQAYLERVVFSPSVRVEVSKTARLFTGATRRAIELRDRICAHPYCDAPLDRCQVDHIIPYPGGGPTTQENGRLLCGFHNRMRNKRPPPGGEEDDDDGESGPFG